MGEMNGGGGAGGPGEEPKQGDRVDENREHLLAYRSLFEVSLMLRLAHMIMLVVTLADR
jgi:hypothetical protein